MLKHDVARRMDEIAAAGIKLKQHPFEMEWACHHVSSHVGLSDVYVEVGAYEGASLYVYGALCSVGGTIIAIDDGKRSHKTRTRLKRSCAMLEKQGYDVRWIRGNSHQQETLDALQEILGKRRVDFLHIDGDHSAAGSALDWRMYGPLVRPGGVTAFHDIRATPPSMVTDTWNKLTNSGVLTRAICSGPFTIGDAPKVHKACGIGLVYT